MENLIKAISISVLMGSTFMSHAMEDTFAWEARQVGMSREAYLVMMGHQPVPVRELPRPVCKAPEGIDSETEMVLAMSLGKSLEQYRADNIGISLEDYLAALDAERSRQKRSSLSTTVVRDDSAERRKQEEASVALIRRLEEEAAQEKRRREEIASLELLQRLQREDEKRKEEEASAEAIGRYKLEEAAEQQRLKKREAEIKLSPSNSVQGLSFICQVNTRSADISKSTDRPVLENFMRIFDDLGKVTQNADVHVLDQYVFGSANNIQGLVKLGALYNIDNSTLTLAQVGEQMIQFVKRHEAIFEKFHYLGTPVSSANIIAYLTSHFSNMDTEVSVMCPAAREIWSRAWTLALRLYAEKHDPIYIYRIFEQAVEGHLTRGGCIQGRIDRGFVGYASLLLEAGVSLDPQIEIVKVYY